MHLNKNENGIKIAEKVTQKKKRKDTINKG